MFDKVFIGSNNIVKIYVGTQLIKMGSGEVEPLPPDPDLPKPDRPTTIEGIDVTHDSITWQWVFDGVTDNLAGFRFYGVDLPDVTLSAETRTFTTGNLRENVIYTGNVIALGKNGLDSTKKTISVRTKKPPVEF